LIEILRYPNRMLTTPTEAWNPAIPYTETPSQISSQLQDAMKLYAGVGLAANQIGMTVAIAVVRTKERGILTLVNPTITFTSDSIDPRGGFIQSTEGCLSLPGIQFVITRSAEIELAWLDEELSPHTETFKGEDAIRIQHETDHLKGILVLDHLSALKRNMLIRKIQKVVRLEKRYEKAVLR